MIDNDKYNGAEVHSFGLWRLLLVVLARGAPIFEEDLNVPAGNVGLSAQLFQLACAWRFVPLKSLNKNPLGRVPDSDNLVFPFPGLLHLSGHEV